MAASNNKNTNLECTNKSVCGSGEKLQCSQKVLGQIYVFHRLCTVNPADWM